MEEVAFDVSGSTYTVPERQATILAENLRLFAKGDFPGDVATVVQLGASPDWREGAQATADWIEEALVGKTEPLPLAAGKAAQAIYWALVLMVGIDISSDPAGAAGLRDSLSVLLGYS